MVCFICGSTFFQHSKSGPLTWWENAKTKEVVMMPGVKYGKKTLNMCKPCKEQSPLVTIIHKGRNSGICKILEINDAITRFENGISKWSNSNTKDEFPV